MHQAAFVFVLAIYLQERKRPLLVGAEFELVGPDSSCLLLADVYA